MVAKLTEPGRRLLAAYLELEAGARNVRGHCMTDAVLRDGTTCRAMTLRFGQGADKMAAEKLQRDGFAIVNWRVGTRLLVITDVGRAAITNAEAA